MLRRYPLRLARDAEHVRLIYRRRMKWLTTLLGIVCVSACTLIPAEQDSTTSPKPAPSVSVTSPEPAPAESREAPEPPPTSDCEPDVRANVQDTIRAQQRSFSDLDFDSARSFASDSFRSDVTADDFAYIIRRDYAFLLGDPSITFEACLQVGDVAVIRVLVQDLPPEQSMVYRLVKENDGWFIDGARLGETRPNVTT
jgi:hypothetical protein